MYLTQSKKILFNTLITWISMVITIYLLGYQTKSINVLMWLFLIFIPLLINLPLIFETQNPGSRVLKKTMNLILIIIFSLSVIASGFSLLTGVDFKTYLNWMQGIVAIVGLTSSTVIFSKGGD